MAINDRRQAELQPSPLRGFLHHERYFDVNAQVALVDELKGVVAKAPPFQPVMPRSGKPFSVNMTNCGSLGWMADRAGYRYTPTHPDTGQPWPPIPTLLDDLWRAVAPHAADPEACLVNFYRQGAKMGSHQDRDEHDFTAPLVSISLGDTATFHIGGSKRTDPKTRIKLLSGDVLVMGGPARLAFHGVDRVHAGTSKLDLTAFGADCCRINLTMRRVSACDREALLAPAQGSG